MSEGVATSEPSGPWSSESGEHRSSRGLRAGGFSSARYPGTISIHWFIHLRWVAVLGQFLTVLIVAYSFGIQLYLGPLLATIGVTAFSNLVLTVWFMRYRRRESIAPDSRIWSRLLPAVMAVDLLLLTCLLYFSGGPSNPFWIFFLVNLCLAGIELTAGIAWCLNFLAVFCFALLLYDHYPLGVESMESLLPSIRETGQVTLVHNGVFCAFITCATVIVFFTTLVTSKLRNREEELRSLEARRIRGEKLEALGTLAAGAAHELSTPLGTIAVVVGELQHELKKVTDNPQVLEDVSLIRSELDRCRAILNHMSAQAGAGTVDKKIDLTGQQLLERLLKDLRDSSRVVNSITPAAVGCVIHVEPYVTVQALRGMIKNALEASPPGSLVFVTLERANGALELTVSDKGEGIPAEILKRIGEPFFTTKQTGKGMGLGVFLARTVVERLGGEIRVESVHHQGTTVRCLIPCKAETTELPSRMPPMHPGLPGDSFDRIQPG